FWLLFVFWGGGIFCFVFWVFWLSICFGGCFYIFVWFCGLCVGVVGGVFGFRGAALPLPCRCGVWGRGFFGVVFGGGGEKIFVLGGFGVGFVFYNLVVVLGGVGLIAFLHF
ncbi:hypothetical protein, partial [Streptomyces sp. SP18CM02]|uniref:hypothetical protein n=1 Tax=Streptomyces sp. SP18CM02 TaxID=2758571 RepID=UPI00168B0BB3